MMPETEKVDASSQPVATGMQQQSYKCLLNQQAQKLWKQLPVYQTYNEGSEHQPKFRTTVWVDGVSYTSPNTFQHRKQAEMDASKITLSALMLKLKNEALQHVREDIRSCKSILVEYAVRMNIRMPTYETVQTGSQLPFFRSSLLFNGVSYTGDDCRAKKEAEQSAARAVILKYLDSETGYMLSEIIKSKFNHHATKETQSAAVQNDTNVVNGNVAKVDEGTKIPYTITPINPPLDIITQTQIPPTIQVLTQTPSAVTTNNVPTMNPLVHVTTQTHVPQTNPLPTVLTQTAPLTGTKNAAPASVHTTPMPTVQTPFVGTNSNSAPASAGHFANIPATNHSNVVQKATTIPDIPIQTPNPTVSMPTVLVQTTPVSGTNNAASISTSASIPESHPFASVVRAINTEAVTPLPTSSPTVTGKKRNRKNKKNAQKKMRSGNQLVMSAIFQGQVPTFSAQ